MIINMHRRFNLLTCLSLLVIVLAALISALLISRAEPAVKESEPKSDYIKWVELAVSDEALEDTMELDIKTYDMLYHISWVDSLSYLACKNGNSWGGYRRSQLDSMVKALGDSYTVDDLMEGNKYYRYYKKAFSAVLGGILGEYTKEAPDGKGGKRIKQGYGLVAYSPVAEGFSYSHFDDFGNSRSYGYRRQHLGNDLMGYVGTPIVSVESGRVECYGWNQYGGWRLGIRSLDGKRSYYYAHLRKDKPYHPDIKEGSVVKAGQVIGYMGMTGYSPTENVNGMKVPHLHFGLQLVFDESQKEGANQIWVDAYKLVKLLSRNRATVIKGQDGEYCRKYDLLEVNYNSP